MNSGSSSSQDDNFLRPLSYGNRTRSGRNMNVTVTDGEIGVFTAEKYFNGQIDKPKSMIKIDPTIYNRSNMISYDPTISIASDSSWYSKSSLLQNTTLKNLESTKRKKGKKKSKTFFSNLGYKCKCSCFDDNSTDIDEKNRQIKQLGFSDLPHQSLSSSADEVFRFPPTINDLPRESLEVFGSSVLQKRNRSLINPNPKSNRDQLLEIESMKGKGKEETCLVRQVRDIESPPHAPSEASVTWSVMTESAVVSSDCNEEVRGESSLRIIGSPIYKHILTNKAKLETKEWSFEDRRTSRSFGESYRIVSPRLDLHLLQRKCVKYEFGSN